MLLYPFISVALFQDLVRNLTLLDLMGVKADTKPFAQCPESKEVYTISLHLRNFHRNVLVLLIILSSSENLLLREKFFSHL